MEWPVVASRAMPNCTLPFLVNSTGALLALRAGLVLIRRTPPVFLLDKTHYLAINSVADAVGCRSFPERI